MNITNSEWKIMKLLWEEPRTIIQLTKALEKETGWKKNTIINMLKRLEEKAAVVHTEGGKAKVFYPNCSKEEVISEESEAFLHKAFEGNVSLFLNAFVRKDRLSEQDVDEICKLLDLKRKEEKGTK